MTLVHFKFTKPSPTGRVPATGTVRFAPSRLLVLADVDGTVVMPSEFSQAVPASGIMSVQLDPTSAGWAWTVQVFGFDGVTAFTDYLLVPDQVEANYSALVKVNPKSLEPIALPEAAWWAELEQTKTLAGDVQAARTEAVAAAAAAEAVGDTNDAIVTGLLQTPTSQFAPAIDGSILAAISAGGAARNELNDAIDESVDAAKGVEIAPMASGDHPSGIVLKSAYDPRTRSYNLNQSTLSKARAAHSRGLNGGKPMQLHFLGHSYLTGLQTAPPYPTNTSPAQVTRALNASARVGKVAEGHRILSYGTAVGARLSDDTRFALAPEWTYISGHGYALSSVYRNISNVGDLVFTPAEGVTHYEIVYLTNAATGAWSFSTGGGFSSSGIVATTPDITYQTRVTDFSATPVLTPLTIRPPATGIVMIQSVRGYVAGNAIEVTNGGVSGSTAGGATVGSWTQVTAGYASALQAVDFYKPDLACIMLGTNDRNGGRTAAQYIDDMRILANRVKAAGGDVIFLREPAPTDAGYTPGLYGLADEIGAGIIETGPDWPATYAAAKAEPYGYIGVDNGHPSTRGHTAISRAVTNALLAAL